MDERFYMAFPLSSAAGGSALQVLFASPVVIGVGLLVDPERMLLLHQLLGLSSIEGAEVDNRLWRLRGAAFVAVGALVLWSRYSSGL